MGNMASTQTLEVLGPYFNNNPIKHLSVFFCENNLSSNPQKAPSLTFGKVLIMSMKPIITKSLLLTTAELFFNLSNSRINL